jgi:hypothetical protein
MLLQNHPNAVSKPAELLAIDPTQPVAEQFRSYMSYGMTTVTRSHGKLSAEFYDTVVKRARDVSDVNVCLKIVD